MGAGPRPVFVLGAYPSALHIRWVPPKKTLITPVQAIAVDNEPEPFWSGKDAEDRILGWKKSIGWDEDINGAALVPDRRCNGGSGRWVEENVLQAIGVSREPDVWITDCLDTYRESKSIENWWSKNKQAMDQLQTNFLIQGRRPGTHPSEDQIVTEAIEGQLDRLRAELLECEPSVVITLGNAALRVFGALCEDFSSLPKKLQPDTSYGQAVVSTVGTRRCTLLPLAHPAAPKAYQILHREWTSKAKRLRF